MIQNKNDAYLRWIHNKEDQLKIAKRAVQEEHQQSRDKFVANLGYDLYI